MGSSFGLVFRVITFGESHGGAVGVVVDGCPPKLPISVEEIQQELNRRRPGQSRVSSAREEADRAEILSGVFEGLTLGTPIALLVPNKDAQPEEYEEIREIYRPSHADYTTQAKYGIRDFRGGGRASARETVGRVAAGAIARKLLKTVADIEVLAWVRSIHQIDAEMDPAAVTLESVEQTPMRCPDPVAAKEMLARIDEARREGDSVGGVIECIARNVPPGLGEPVFEKLEAELAKAMLSIPACKGFEIGSGFSGARMTGSIHNDPFIPGENGRPRTKSNLSGGVQGGISNGEPILLRAAFKPTATIQLPQQTVNRKNEKVTLKARGRHDPCVAPRAAPIVEAMTCLVLADFWLRQRAVDVL